MTRALTHALAHADNRHRRPLRDALDAGCTALEIDVWVLCGRVFIGHSVPHPVRTLRRTYLQPLTDLIGETGCVLEDFDEPVLLLLDVKTSADRSREVIERELARHTGVVSCWRDGHFVPGRLTVVLTGTLMGRPYDAPRRWTATDGRLRHPSSESAGVVPLRSDCWPEIFSWTGEGPMPSAERALLDELVQHAHDRGQRVRFWGTPDVPGETRDNLWSTLLDAGVDYLGTDDLAGVRAFFSDRE